MKLLPGHSRGRSRTAHAVLLMFCLFAAPLARAQQAPPPAGAQPLDASMRSAVIEGALTYLKNTYVFPEVAAKMEAAIRERQQRKEYDQVTRPGEFASLLTSHLQEVSRDKHLRVTYSPEPIPARRGVMETPEDQARRRAQMAWNNFGFEKIERLRGNVGYLEFIGFQDPQLAAETAAAAMNFLAGTDALIIDLRRNGGGSPQMVALLCSYFFDKRTHLNDIYDRPSDRTQEFYTLETLSGKRYGEQKDVYVLTSRRTFSAAEEFTYNLKNLKRATIVGETTGGGAHPTTFRRINDHFGIGVPMARSINPITKTNWEGTGVKPDIEVAADRALTVAHLDALKRLAAKNVEPARADLYKQVQAALQQDLNKNTTPEGARPANTGSAAPSVTEVKLPDTPAGKTMAAFLDMFNSGDLARMKRFHKEREGSDENAEQDMNFYNQSGGLTLHGVVSATATTITVLVQAKKDGHWLNFTINVQEQPPHAVDTIRIDPTSAPGGKAPGTTAAPAKKLTEAEAVKEAETFLDQQAAEDKFSGAVLIARDGQPVFKKAYGLANKSSKAPNRTDTKFNLGSMNKMFTAVAIAQLAEKGKLSFTDTVGKHLPDYPNKDVRDNVTIHQLLTHTSGLGSYWNRKFDERKAAIRTVSDYMALFADEPPRFPPGERFEYSNSGFIVLGAIVEKAAGTSYYDYVREKIYKPAGMTNSDCYEMTEKTPNLAMGYAKMGVQAEGSAARQENTATRPNRGGPAGGGYSTVEDLLKFAAALVGNKLLSAKSTELITTGKVAMGGGGARYAYGFGDMRVNGKRSFGHNGGAPGIASSLAIFPANGYVVAVMTNYDPPDLRPVVSKLEQTIATL